MYALSPIILAGLRRDLSVNHQASKTKPVSKTYLLKKLVSFPQQAPLCGTVLSTQFRYSASKKNHHKAILNGEFGFSFHK